MALIFYGTFLSTASSSITGTPFSVSMLIEGDGEADTVPFQIGSGGDYAKIITNGSAEVALQYSDGVTTRTLTATSSQLTQTAQRVTLVCTSTASYLYVGESKYTDSASVDPAPDSTFSIGSDPGGKSPAIDLTAHDLAVWSVALTDADVSSLVNGASPLSVQASGLAHYYQFPHTADPDVHQDLIGGAKLSADSVSVLVVDGRILPYPLLDNKPMVAIAAPRRAWERLAPWYSVTFLVTSVDISEYVEPGSFSVKDTGGIELETMSFTMRTPPTATPYEWRELEVWVDYGTVNQMCIFGGMIVKDTRKFSSAGTEVLHTCKAEGFKTLLARSKPFAKSYKDQTVTAIIEDMLTDGERVSNPAFTVQATDETISFWTKELDENIAKNIERMCQEYGWRWRVTWDKVIVVGPEGEDVAPFGVCQASQADYFMLFPVENVDYEIDGAEIANSIYLVGGMATSDEQTENFVGDGTTTIFSLDVHPIASITSIKVDGVTKSWGTIGYHSCSERDALVHFAQGYVSFCTAPANTKSIEIKYTYNFPYTYTTFSEPAQSQYHDVVLWELVEADWISDDTQAAAYCSTILAERALSPERLTCELRRAGLRAGQTCPVAFNDLGISAGSYMHVDSVGISQDQSRRLRFSVRLGPSDVRLTRTIGQTATVV